MVGLVSRAFWLGPSSAGKGFRERDRIVIFEGEGFRVSSSGTGVAGAVALPAGGVARCIGIADASLSLSLSLVGGGSSRL
jgi:hypothetical protein